MGQLLTAALITSPSPSPLEYDHRHINFFLGSVNTFTSLTLSRSHRSHCQPRTRSTHPTPSLQPQCCHRHLKTKTISISMFTLSLSSSVVGFATWPWAHTIENSTLKLLISTSLTSPSTTHNHGYCLLFIIAVAYVASYYLYLCLTFIAVGTSEWRT